MASTRKPKASNSNSRSSKGKRKKRVPKTSRGARARAKGLDGERAVANSLNAAFVALGFDTLHAERNLEETRQGEYDVRVMGPGPQLPSRVTSKTIEHVIQVKTQASKSATTALRDAIWDLQKVPNWHTSKSAVVKFPLKRGAKTGSWVAVITLKELSELLMFRHFYETMTEPNPSYKKA